MKGGRVGVGGGRGKEEHKIIYTAPVVPRNIDLYVLYVLTAALD